MRQAPFDWRPYIIEFHAQAPKLMKSRAFVLGGVLQLRLSGNGMTLENYVCVAPDGEVRGGLCASFGTIGLPGLEPTAEPERMKNAMGLIIRSMLAPSREKEYGVDLAKGEDKTVTLCFNVGDEVWLILPDAQLRCIITSIVDGRYRLMGPQFTEYQLGSDHLLPMSSTYEERNDRRSALYPKHQWPPEPKFELGDRDFRERVKREMVAAGCDAITRRPHLDPPNPQAQADAYYDYVGLRLENLRKRRERASIEHLLD